MIWRDGSASSFLQCRGTGRARHRRRREGALGAQTNPTFESKGSRPKTVSRASATSVAETSRAAVRPARSRPTSAYSMARSAGPMKLRTTAVYSGDRLRLGHPAHHRARDQAVFRRLRPSIDRANTSAAGACRPSGVAVCRAKAGVLRRSPARVLLQRDAVETMAHSVSRRRSPGSALLMPANRSAPDVPASAAVAAERAARLNCRPDPFGMGDRGSVRQALEGAPQETPRTLTEWAQCPEDKASVFEVGAAQPKRGRIATVSDGAVLPRSRRGWPPMDLNEAFGSIHFRTPTCRQRPAGKQAPSGRRQNTEPRSTAFGPTNSRSAD